MKNGGSGSWWAGMFFFGVGNLVLGFVVCSGGEKNMINLPEVRHDSGVSVERAVRSRRSHRSFADRSLSLEKTAQLLWAGQGITGSVRRRAAPSAGALYPLELYLIADRVSGLAEGVYRYLPDYHALRPVLEKGRLREVAGAALHQNFIAGAPLALVITGVEERTADKYGERAARYVFIEAGCSAENIHLQAEALGLGTVIVGAFHDKRLHEVLHMGENELPLLIMPVGYVD
ncbi:MAG: SagB/ThcOx family dehydrogenase [Desulfurivibrionaceae bacterium]